MARQKQSTPTEAPLSRRERLLRAGEAMFTRLPYDEVSISDVAARAGVAHGLVFHYFGNKRGFLLAVVEAALSRVTSQMLTNDEPDPVRWLHGELDMFLDGISEQEQLYLVVVRNSFGPEVGKVLARMQTLAVERVLDKLAPTRRSPALTIAIRGWVSYNNELGVGFLNHPGIPRRRVREVAIGMLNASLESVAASSRRDPGFDPATFAG